MRTRLFFGCAFALSLATLVAAGAASGAPAARASDRTSTGGTILAGSPTVLVCGEPAARAGDLATSSAGVAPIVTGSATVLIGGASAARAGDRIAPPVGGVITTGCPTVLIGP